MKEKLLLAYLTGFIILFSACSGGGGGSSDSSPSTGTSVAYLIDSGVGGVTYSTPSRSGLTGIDGSLVYTTGESNVTFSIGGIFLYNYNLSTLNSDKKILITDLVGVDRNDSTDAKVVKILQLLQSLDSDNNASNGITIDSNTTAALAGSTLNFSDTNLSITDINTTLVAIGESLVTQDEAIAHFEQTLNEDFNYSVDSIAPIFISLSSITMSENQSFVLNIDVLDSTAITLSLSGGDSAEFNLNSSTLSFKVAPDFETKTTYTLSVTASDSMENNTTQNLTINITDIYEVVPINITTLVVIMNWNDYSENDPLIWHNKFFDKTLNSVNQWYEETTGGKLQIVPLTESSGTANDGIIMVDMGKNHPGGADNTAFRDTEIANAITNLEVVNNADFAALDTDGDGSLDRQELQIVFIVSGGESSYGDAISHSIWAHAWSFPSNSAPSVDGVKVMRFTGVRETSGGYARFGANHGAHKATIGIIAHELGHSLLDLGDYYDNGGGSGLGWYDIMSGGSWARKDTDSYSGETPMQFSAYNRVDAALDARAINVNSAQTLSIKCSSRELIKLITTKANEYFLIECRDTAKSNSDISLDYADSSFTDNRLFMMAYHVDTDKNDNTQDGVQTDANHYKVALVEKDSSTLMTETENLRANYSDVYTLGNVIDTTKTRLYDGTDTNYSIEVTGEDYTNRTMTISITK